MNPECFCLRRVNWCLSSARKHCGFKTSEGMVHTKEHFVKNEVFVEKVGSATRPHTVVYDYYDSVCSLLYTQEASREKFLVSCEYYWLDSGRMLSWEGDIVMFESGAKEESWKNAKNFCDRVQNRTVNAIWRIGTLSLNNCLWQMRNQECSFFHFSGITFRH